MAFQYYWTIFSQEIETFRYLFIDINCSKSKNVVNLRTNMFAIINHNQTNNILYLDLLSYIRWLVI